VSRGSDGGPLSFGGGPASRPVLHGRQKYAAAPAPSARTAVSTSRRTRAGRDIGAESPGAKFRIMQNERGVSVIFLFAFFLLHFALKHQPLPSPGAVP